MDKKNNNTNAGSNVDIMQLIGVFLSYWKLYVISCIFFLGIAFVFIKYASRTYSVQARIMIHANRMRTRTSNQYVNVNDLMNQEKNLNNEINFMLSSPLIEEVIEDMNLNVFYYIKDPVIPPELDFGLQNMYTKSPITVVMNKSEKQPIGVLFYIDIIDEQTFYLYGNAEQIHLHNYKEDETSEFKYNFALSGRYKFGQTISNGKCSFRIILNSNYKPEIHDEASLFFRFNQPTQLAYAFQESISISSNFYQSSIANLTFVSSNVDLAKEFLDNLINKYIEKNIEKKNYEANSTIDYIENQLSNISGDLGKTESRLHNLRNRQEVMDIDDKYSELLGGIQELEMQEDNLASQIQSLERLNNYFEENKDAKTFIAPSFTGMSDETLTTLIQELTALSRERQDLISTNQLRNPRIKTLDANISSILKVITDNISFTLNTARNELAETQQKIFRLRNEYSQLPKTQRELIELEREFAINDEVYTTLMNSRIQAKIIQASNKPDVEILEPVRYDMIMSPSPKKIGAIMLFLGLFFPSIPVIFINFLTPKIRTKQDLMKYAPLASIGEIPRNDKPSYQNVISNFPHKPIVERFHILRTNIIYSVKEQANKVILVTSTLPSEGKSFTSYNLALSFASANYKTLLIALDLRKNSKVFEELNKNALVGLDSYLIDKANIQDVVTNTAYPNLDFIPKGQIPPNPTALLSSSRIDELFEIARNTYDYVIVDTPPFGLVTDAKILMNHADISLYVARLGVITKKAIKQSMENLSEGDMDNVFLVKNDITKVDRTYYESYSYHDKPKKGLLSWLGLKKNRKKNNYS